MHLVAPHFFYLLQRKGRSKYNMIFEFQYEMNGIMCDMAVTSVTGHLMETDFAPEYKQWKSCDPSALLDLSCPVIKFVRKVR
jgi:DNA topoisomerase-3